MSVAALLAARRHFFQQCRVGVGAMALESLLAAEREAAADSDHDPLAARPPHFQPRAKSVIFLFMAGGEWSHESPGATECELAHLNTQSIKPTGIEPGWSRRTDNISGK